jgi:hypothetical protein
VAVVNPFWSSIFLSGLAGRLVLSMSEAVQFWGCHRGKDSKGLACCRVCSCRFRVAVVVLGAVVGQVLVVVEGWPRGLFKAKRCGSCAVPLISHP